MLTHLTISNIVLIEELSLSMKSGLTALTGETGAGKSILLDSLGLTLGQRAESGLLRKGATQGTVTAVFDLPNGHHVYDILDANAIDHDDELILKRQITSDGKSKAFINDRPVSVALLKEIGDQLIDIHGQFETHGLMDSKNHGVLLDGFGGLQPDVINVNSAWKAWRTAQKDLENHIIAMQKAKEDEEYLIDCVAALEKINPIKGEEAELTAKRQRLQSQESIIQGLNEAYQALDADKGANEAVYTSLRALEKIADKAEDKIDPFITRLDAALSNLRDIAGDIEMMAHGWGEFDDNIEHVDDRIHELRAAARKHNCAVDLLPEMLADMQSALQNIRDDEGLHKQLEAAVVRTAADYNSVATALTDKRLNVAGKLSDAVMHELPDLKLGNAIFRVAVDALPSPSAYGYDDIHFLIRTNPGSPEGELGKVASGGELSRIMLALKVVLSDTTPVPVMVFDEVDSGIGGATADAVGARLSRMADACQILVVTHSPQVAAKANHHWIVSKSDSASGTTSTTVTPLNDESVRIDEIARMVSGAQLTDEARAAAKVLRNVA
jgi:DNA repair protein RecN (Recombination protein N)